MFYEQRTSVPDSPAALRTTYEAQLAAIVDRHGVDEVADATGVEPGTLGALAGEEPVTLTLDEAAAIAAVEPDTPDAEVIVAEACEHLLLGMSTAVLDVETLASHLDLELEPREIQQKIERRAPMDFEEFVHVQHVVVDRSP